MTVVRILVGVDGSPDGLVALSWAAELAAQTGAEVVAVHAVGLLEQERPELRAAFESSWCAPLDRPGLRARRLLRNGNPVGVLLATAQEVDADLLVVGSRGIGGPAELVLGSTSTQVAQRANQPVVIVPGATVAAGGGAPTPGHEQVLLRDGRAVTVRPATRSDATRLAELLAGIEPAEVRDRLVHLDAAGGVTYVALDGDRPVALGRYAPDHDPAVAEVVVAVDDDWRTVGLGTRLLVILGLHAVEEGVQRFRARYQEEQGDVARVAAASGMPHRIGEEDGTRTVEIDLVSPAT